MSCRFPHASPNAFTGFTTNGSNRGLRNISGGWDYGYNFNNRITSPDATVWFPASGSRSGYDGLWYLGLGEEGYYWSAVPRFAASSCNLYFNGGYVEPTSFCNRADGVPVRPVADN